VRKRQPNTLPENDDPMRLEPRPDPVPVTPESNYAQVKRDYESGSTGDKIPVIDPGAAPLGTDSEAGGAPALDPRVIGEMRSADRAAAPERGEAGLPEGPRRRSLAIFVTVILVIILIGACVLAWTVYRTA
jgi:hypothetical protein